MISYIFLYLVLYVSYFCTHSWRPPNELREEPPERKRFKIESSHGMYYKGTALPASNKSKV